jgi:DNA-directed RNA polymerase specialized sigma24 family protein
METAMEPNCETEMTTMIRQSLAVMPMLEAKFIQECHLMGKSRKHFASENGLSSQSVAELQGRAFAQLRERLTEKNNQSMGDVL